MFVDSGRLEITQAQKDRSLNIAVRLKAKKGALSGVSLRIVDMFPRGASYSGPSYFKTFRGFRTRVMKECNANGVSWTALNLHFVNDFLAKSEALFLKG